MRKPAEVFPPGEYLRDELAERGWSQADFADILDRPPRLVSEIISGKRSISPETARGISAAFGSTPEYWMNLQSRYDLWHTSNDAMAVAERVERRAQLFKTGPIKEMMRRGWIEPSENLDVLEHRVNTFFRLDTLGQQPAFALAAAARKATSYTEDHTTSQVAWLCRARQIAPGVPCTSSYSPQGFATAIGRLEELRLSVQEVRHIPRVLGDAGIRLVVVEALPGTKIDAACFWLDEKSPVLSLSLRYDRIDNLWWGLFHELGHIKHGHGKEEAVLDTDMVDGPKGARPKSEELADAFASEHVIPQDALENFIARVYSVYSQEKIEGFAKTVGVHPGIVVGQLQSREEISFATFRKLLVPIRDVMISAALTDGWGHTVSLGKGN
jgi:HTH-type transcriptional regulator/antitoxin HigA